MNDREAIMRKATEKNRLADDLQCAIINRVLEVVKMRRFTPCRVSDKSNNYKGRIVEVVFDPLRVPQINAKFKRAGYRVRDNMSVIAVTEDKSVLIWGGLNSVFHLRKGDTISGPLDFKHLAFNDISDLTEQFKIKNTKAEIDKLIAQLKRKRWRK